MKKYSYPLPRSRSILRFRHANKTLSRATFVDHGYGPYRRHIVHLALLLHNSSSCFAYTQFLQKQLSILDDKSVSFFLVWFLFFLQLNLFCFCSTCYHIHRIVHRHNNNNWEINGDWIIWCVFDYSLNYTLIAVFQQ